MMNAGGNACVRRSSDWAAAARIVPSPLSRNAQAAFHAFGSSAAHAAGSASLSVRMVCPRRRSQAGASVLSVREGGDESTALRIAGSCAVRSTVSGSSVVGDGDVRRDERRE
jgi:hypothetical protein